ncbi:hypothetical protein HUN59_09170 [Curtobacterium sp. Csp2]|uniref:hypothetical protein n=1 Tax=Curtobacterium sp. Csp2 TaxID=2495430 RepID=UPI0015807B46|nr:hypothetical protein [Curtobacterium sp. Csp2]QKS16361.1 hypothetical protein HUN59_09170 [Curtobacterium sp. Csp2]
MSLLVARTALVGTAVLLGLAAVLLALDGPARAVLFGAACCCALLDRASSRSLPTTSDEPEPESTRTRPLPGTSDDPPARQAQSRRSDLLLGHDDDGEPIGHELGTPGLPTHLVVVGTGALALAVFVELADLLRATATATGTATAGFGGAVRTALADDLVDARPPVAALDGAPAGVSLPAETAVAVLSDADERIRTTIVLVPSERMQPRAWDTVVEVTRYGCAVRRAQDHRSRALDPALPSL